MHYFSFAPAVRFSIGILLMFLIIHRLCHTKHFLRGRGKQLKIHFQNLSSIKQLLISRVTLCICRYFSREIKLIFFIIARKYPQHTFGPIVCSGFYTEECSVNRSYEVNSGSRSSILIISCTQLFLFSLPVKSIVKFN